MTKSTRCTWFVVASLLLLTTAASAQESKLPTLPVGLDAYRKWDQWPMQRLGVRAYMRSTYQRTGTGSQHDPSDPGYEWTDASHFLYYTDDECVTLDVKGKGILYFFRANKWHGSPWTFRVDGQDNVVRETATADPVNASRRVKDPKFIPEAPFPEPLNWTWATTKGADLIGTPMAFRQSLRIGYGRTYYGTGYYIYHLYPDEAHLSQPIGTWDLSQTPDADVLELLRRAGDDIAPSDIEKQSGTLRLDGSRQLLAEIDGAATIRAVKLTLPLNKAIDLERTRLVATWDGAEHPSIDAPLSLFFGTGTFYNRDRKEFLVKGFPINVRFDYENERVELACYFPMPFFKSARFELVADKPADAEIGFEIRHEPFTGEPNASGYFHATYQDFPKPELGKEMIFLDTRGAEGHETWSGTFVGTSYIFSHDAVLHCLEGDPKFYFDDAQTPQAHGTGSEEWAGGGSFWGGQRMTLPLYGHPVGASGPRSAKNDLDKIESAYRFLLADAMPFGRRAVIAFEQGDMFMQEHYEAVTYWYGLPAPSLVKTDHIDIGDADSEAAHDYVSPDASPIESITSWWDGAGMEYYPAEFRGHDMAKKYPELRDKIGKRIYPEETQTGRHTRGTSEFTVKLDPDNLGALLRRTLDYSIPNQTAKVFVADASGGKATGERDWEEVGVWHLAGSTTHLYSWPRHGKAELAERIVDVQHSDRRFRDDEFQLPQRVTGGRSAIRVRVTCMPDEQPLHPGKSFPKESAWSELEYDVFSVALPKFSPPVD